MVNKSNNLVTNRQSNFDNQYYFHLYEQVLKRFYDSYPDDVDAEINRALKTYTSHGPQNGDFGCEFLRLGYLFRYAAHGALLTRFRILEGLQYCPELQIILQKEQLNVAILGGGPGNNMIGFCGAMSESRFEGNLTVCVVDAVEQWQTDMTVTEELVKEGDFGEVSNIFKCGKVRSSFIRGILPNLLFLPGTFDVVIICKLINHLTEREKWDLTRNLNGKLKPAGFVLLIDTKLNLHLWRDLFEDLYSTPKKYRIFRSGTSAKRFGFHNHVTDHARIAVLRKMKTTVDDNQGRCAARDFACNGFDGG